MTTHDDDALRDVVAEARALLAKMEERASKYGWSADGAIYSLTLRRLADECDALRKRVAGLDMQLHELKWTRDNRSLAQG